VRFDLLIKGGRLVDPGAGLDGLWDVGITHDRVAAIARDIPIDASFQVVDASSKVVTPGLVDLHSHVFDGIGYWGISADTMAAISGVTTWLDAGSAGALTLAGFRSYIVDPAIVRIYAFLNVSYLGLIGPDFELARSEFCDVAILERIANSNRDVVRGIKVRMGSPTVGPNGIAPMKTAIEAARLCELPLMVHIADGPPEVDEVLDLMRPGDIVTHCFTGAGMRLMDERGQAKEAALRARDRGVIMDIGHGIGSFSFSSAEALLNAGFTPDAISTDIHQLSIGAPMYDMPTCMTKFLALGLSLEEVVRASTIRPAEAVGLHDRAGTLTVGASADVAIFELVEGAFPVHDIEGDIRYARQALRHVMTIVGGRTMERRPSEPRSPWAEPGHGWPPRQAELIARASEIENACFHRDNQRCTPRLCNMKRRRLM
jgi:dihydroorotase